LDGYLIIKTIHILSSTILFGTGMGIAFFMFSARFSSVISQQYYAARYTVIADYVFTLPAVVLQPLSGLWLVSEGGYDYSEPWLIVTYILYIFVGLCWLPVVWIQIQMKNILAQALAEDTELPGKYHKLFRLWFLLGWPAFIGLVAIFFVMVFKKV